MAAMPVARWSGAVNRWCSPEPRPCRSHKGEAAAEVKTFGVRIADDVQSRGAVLAGKLAAVFDQRPPDSAPLPIRFDKQPVQFHFSVRPRQHGRKTDNRFVHLGHENAAIQNLLERQIHGVGNGQQRVAIAGITQRGTHLQRLELLPLPGDCSTDLNAGHFDTRRVGYSNTFSKALFTTKSPRNAKRKRLSW